MHFPDKRLLQYDCGKLQELAGLLRRLHDGGHKVVLFAQMSRVLDVLESFANMHRFTYLRLDGATRVDQRQILVERFNRDPRVFLFLSTTRSGGFGINLTGADTVVFYDSDWNPAVDAQAQDRCHRIGQTRPVTIYRLVTECTVEENILKKARQKKALNRLVIKEGSFTTDFLAELGLEQLVRARSTPAAVTDAAAAAAAGAVAEEAVRVPEARVPDGDDDAGTADEDRTLMKQLLRGDDAPEAVDDDFAEYEGTGAAQARDDTGGDDVLTAAVAAAAAAATGAESTASIDEQIDSELSGVQRFALALYEAQQQDTAADDD